MEAKSHFIFAVNYNGNTDIERFIWIYLLVMKELQYYAESKDSYGLYLLVKSLY